MEIRREQERGSSYVEAVSSKLECSWVSYVYEYILRTKYSVLVREHSAPVVLTREQREHWRWRYVESKSEVVAT